VVVAVVLDEPIIGRYGGDLAGPIFRRVAEATLRYLGVSPQSGATAPLQAKRDADHPGASSEAARSTPPAVPKPPAPSSPQAVLAPADVHVPDATGMAAHDVVVMLTKFGFTPQIEGSGRAVRQNPPAGAAALKGSAVRVVLEPES
jgi:cell division protein FtsI (penicillin-binding protein 3)